MCGSVLPQVVSFSTVNCHSNGFGVSIGPASFTPEVGMKIWEQPGKADLENESGQGGADCAFKLECQLDALA